jgi:hypothetical protein
LESEKLFKELVNKLEVKVSEKFSEESSDVSTEVEERFDKANIVDASDVVPEVECGEVRWNAKTLARMASELLRYEARLGEDVATDASVDGAESSDEDTTAEKYSEALKAERFEAFEAGKDSEALEGLLVESSDEGDVYDEEHRQEPGGCVRTSTGCLTPLCLSMCTTMTVPSCPSTAQAYFQVRFKPQ